MNKRKFGMSTLKLKQGRFESYSHWDNAYDLSGQDGGKEWIKAPTTMKVMGVHRFNKSNLTAFFNTVHLYDRQHVIWWGFIEGEGMNPHFVTFE